MTTPSETATETFQSEATDLSWVEFSADDRPGCYVRSCDNEAIKKIKPLTCCDKSFAYCIEHFAIHHQYLTGELQFMGYVIHAECMGEFTDIEVTDL
jgi:hypothetical protein